MIMGSLYSLNAKDLLSAVISYGIVGFGLVICFLMLQAPDLAIVQIVVEVITLIIMISVIKNTTHEELAETRKFKALVGFAVVIIFAVVFLYIFNRLTGILTEFGEHFTRMATAYLEGAHETGSANLVTGVVFDFRAYDTLGEATVLFTAVIGVLTILRLKGRKKEK
jgi:multisubunit Na+/H+ antiporter MnhB subunit